jgi:serine/threonine protein kinase
LIRSPEEIAFKLKQTKRRDILLEKSDVYTLGNVMYYVFTMQWLFQGLDAADAAKKVTEGIRSPFPQKLLESPDRAIRAMRKAIEMCWTHDPKKRPTADEVRSFLGKELKAVFGVEESDVVSVRVTSIEALPKDYSYSDSDFHTMFD